MLFCRGRQKKCTKIQNARAKLLFCSVNLLFGDVPVAVAVVIAKTPFFKKLLRPRRRQRRLKMKLYFAYESHTLKSFTLFITVKAITKLNLGHRNKFEIEFYKIGRRSSRSSGNAELVISRCCFAEDGKEMYKDL